MDVGVRSPFAVGARHPRYLGTEEKVSTAVPRPDAIANVVPRRDAIAFHHVGVRHRRYFG
ncbi:MAG: hypothetical protein AB4352_08405 [Hormoscilla sp.]